MLSAVSVDFPKTLVHKFDIKKALADIQSVDRGDVTEIMSIPPSVRITGRSTPVLGTGRSTPVSTSSTSRQPANELRAGSPKVTVTRRASAVDECQSVSLSMDVRKIYSDLSKSSEELDGVVALVRAERSNHMTATLPESSAKVDSSLDDVVKRTSASEENLLSAEHRLNDVTDIKQLARLQEESKSCSACHEQFVLICGLNPGLSFFCIFTMRLTF